MKKTVGSPIEWAGAVVLLMIGFVVVLTLFPKMGTDAWASWVQAIGSIAAICIAIAIAYWQQLQNHKVIESVDRRELRRRAESVAAIFEEAIRQIKVIGEQLQGHGFSRHHNDIGPRRPQDYDVASKIAILNLSGKKYFEQILRVIDDIPVHTLGSTKMVSAIFMLRDSIQNFENILTESNDDPTTRDVSNAFNGTSVAVVLSNNALILFNQGVNDIAL